MTANNRTHLGDFSNWNLGNAVMFKVNIHATTAIYTEKTSFWSRVNTSSGKFKSLVYSTRGIYMKSYFYGISKAENSLLTERESYLGIWSQRQVFFFSRNKKSMHISEEE